MSAAFPARVGIRSSAAMNWNPPSRRLISPTIISAAWVAKNVASARTHSNTAWRVEAFNAYADHMQTDEFRGDFAELVPYGKRRATAIMCSEALPWRCHRRVIADALVAADWTVRRYLHGQEGDRTSAYRFRADSDVE